MFWLSLQFGFMYVCLASPLTVYDLTDKEHFSHKSQHARQGGTYSGRAMNTDLLDILFLFV